VRKINKENVMDNISSSEMALCPKCFQYYTPEFGHSCPHEVQVATDAHHTASALIAEITDLRAQLAGEKATNARLQGLLNQATTQIAGLERTPRLNNDGEWI
jgi:hypothetical protein